MGTEVFEGDLWSSSELCFFLGNFNVLSGRVWWIVHLVSVFEVLIKASIGSIYREYENNNLIRLSSPASCSIAWYAVSSCKLPQIFRKFEERRLFRCFLNAFLLFYTILERYSIHKWIATRTVTLTYPICRPQTALIWENNNGRPLPCNRIPTNRS